MPPDVVDRRQDIETTTVINEDTLIGYLLGEAERDGVDLLDDVDAVAVVEAHLAYLDAIGAVGPPATRAPTPSDGARPRRDAQHGGHDRDPSTSTST